MSQQHGSTDDGTAIDRVPSAGKLAAGAGLALGATFVAAGTAEAADFNVTNTNQSGAGSLRDAIDQANLNAGADRVLIQSSVSGTINANQPSDDGPFQVYEAVQILGPGAGQLRISGNAETRIFEIDTADGDDVLISDLTLIQGGGKYDNGAPIGGDIQSFNADLTVADSVVRTGVAGLGGGIAQDSGSLTVRDSTVSGNLASFLGGGIYSDGDEAPTLISGSTISDNGVGSKYFGYQDNLRISPGATEPSERYVGGGGAGLAGATVITNSTFTGNMSSSQGGGLILGGYNEEIPQIRSTTISGNSAGAGGGIYAYSFYYNGPPPPAASLINTIVAGNEADGSINGPDLGGGPFNAAFSLIGNTDSVGIFSTVAGSNLFNIDPQLGALANNGGPTKTMSLLDGSPALDKGSASLAGTNTDQRGQSRPVDINAVGNATAPGNDGGDIGAFERQNNPVSGTCDGQTATITGTDDRDILNGTNGADVFTGLGGNDAIRGFGGNDVICAGAGLDQVTGGIGNDRVIGGDDNDRLYGQDGNDTLTDNNGDDLLSGGLGNDTQRGGADEDRVFGAKGNDRLFGQGDEDVVLGAKGDDFVRGGEGNDRVNGGLGDDDVRQ